MLLVKCAPCNGTGDGPVAGKCWHCNGMKECPYYPDCRYGCGLGQSDHEKFRHMIEFGLQSKAELSAIVVAVAIGIFGVLQILNITERFSAIWWALSGAYWAFYGLGVWAFANHQMFASLSDMFLRKINPRLVEDLKEATEGNFWGRIVANAWSRTPYGKQKFRMWAIFSAFTIASLFLWITIGFFGGTEFHGIPETTKIVNGTG